jgi:excisionase family DNA binding protein
MTTTERMTQAQVAALLGWGRDKVRRLTANGTLPALTDPETGRPYYLRTTLTAWARRMGELHAERGAA